MHNPLLYQYNNLVFLYLVVSWSQPVIKQFAIGPDWF